MIVQLCGLSGAGKSTLSTGVKQKLENYGVRVELIDGDDYRSHLCRDLGFSREDRMENIRRLGFVASKLSAHGIVVIISAINPYNTIREELANSYENVKTIYLDCALDTLIARDTKGLYRRALLENGHPDKIYNLTGINDPFEVPAQPDIHIQTDKETLEQSVNTVFRFIVRQLPGVVSRFD
ncbi:adenylyl-sulfate kinase [Deminuibacter soli]|uniref:Adenylyl-sulfate kinase n=1 Tax=Deminuibacter soli TaxID=2291815 RepID=A0A3E1NCP8_9BACT|nr:adenylyl-sulfate kinase [Deminuibacter soli]RFM25621.1 adenylyl-sulfate kinase [Deminuibacter soli]